MSKLFGTDGVRGVANIAPMTAETVLKIGRAAAFVCKEHGKEHRHRILIGKDTRVSGYMLENALTAGITSMGVDVLLVGPMPTPGIAFITRSMRADAGIVLSASHNPYQDNGIKIFSRHGFKLPGSVEAEIENLVAGGHIKDIRPTAHDIGKAERIEDARGRYIVFCKNTFPEDVTLDGLKMVLDCANGATYRVAPIILRELGAEVFTIHDKPNGLNINDNCGSQFTSDLCAAVRDLNADIGLAFDGDGDRLIAVDETGKTLTGDHILAICAKHYKEQGLLINNKLVSTPMSNLGFSKAMQEMGIERLVSDVGDRYVLEKMQTEGAVLGGEESGHIIFIEHHTTGDGIIAALQLLAAVCRSGEPLSHLAKVMTVYPQKMINVTVQRKPPLQELSEVSLAISSAEKELAENGRILVRYSGTQAICRVMVEGPTTEDVERICTKVAKVVQEELG